MIIPLSWWRGSPEQEVIWVVYTRWIYCLIDCWTWKKIYKIWLSSYCITVAFLNSDNETVTYWESITGLNRLEVSFSNICTAHSSFCSVDEKDICTIFMDGSVEAVHLQLALSVRKVWKILWTIQILKRRIVFFRLNFDSLYRRLYNGRYKWVSLFNLVNELHFYLTWLQTIPYHSFLLWLSFSKWLKLNEICKYISNYLD